MLLNTFISFALLLIPFCVISQETDSSQTATYVNFFGSDCPKDADSIGYNIGKADQCILYPKTRQLCRVHKGKVKWRLDVSRLAIEDGYMCLIIRNSQPGRKPNPVVVVLGYSEDRETGRQFVQFRSGKVLK